MAAKFFLVLIMALCLVQGLSAMSTHKKHGSQRDVIDDIINEALEKAREAVHNVNVRAHEILEAGKVAVENAAANIIASAKVLLENAVTAVEGLAKTVAARIDELLAEAAANGQDIASCVEGKAEEAEKIEEDAIDNMKKCFADAEQVEADIKTTFEQVVSEVEAQLDVVEGEVLSCIPEPSTTEHSLEEAQQIASCLVAEINKLPEEQQALLAQVAAEVLAAEQKAEAAIEAAAACLATEEQAALDKEHALVKEIEKCIADLP